jgi:hypothetical protein
MWIGWTLAPVIAARPSGAASNSVAFLHQRHPDAFSGGADCCPTSGYASANDQDVGIDFVLFLIVYSIRPGRCRALPLKEIVPVSHLIPRLRGHNKTLIRSRFGISGRYRKRVCMSTRIIDYRLHTRRILENDEEGRVENRVVCFTYKSMP